ncbi:MAG: FtsX-like permease family protein [Planctomycetota bacterium]|nr:MAG: FtsX-like permease family protein [Planctomycetota bacterium]
MMILLREAWRRLRGRPAWLIILIACLALGVMARVLVGSALNDIRTTVQAEARQVVGSDLRISADRHLSAERQDDLRQLLPAASQTTTTRHLVTMAAREDDAGARLVLLRGVAADWPLRGTLRLADADGTVHSGGAAAQARLGQGRVLVEQDLLVQLELDIGDSLRLGERSFTISGVLKEEPGGGTLMLTIGPTVLIADDELDATGLTGFASRVTHSTLVAMPWSNDPEQLAVTLREQWGLPEERNRGLFNQTRVDEHIRVTTAQEALAGVERFLTRFGDFLHMLALLAVLLGAVGVAHLQRGFVQATIDDNAVLAVLGARPQQIVGVLVLQTVILGLAGGLAGAVLAALLYMAGVAVAGPWLPLELRGLPDFGVMLWGISLGLLASIFAGLPSALALRAVPPLAVLRSTMAQLPHDRWAALGVWSAALLVAVLIGALEMRSWRLGPALVLGACGLGIILAVLTSVLIPILQRLRRYCGHFGLRHGIANLARPGFRPTAAVVALGLAACALGVLATYRSSLDASLSTSLDQRAPGIYALSIPSTEVERFQALVGEEFAATVDMAPVITARLRAINDVAVRRDPPQEGREAERRHWFRTREQRLSWRHDLGPEERVVRGRWLDPQGSGEASISREMHEEGGIHLGDRLRFDIQGVEREVTVTSIREVDWMSFRLNFFVLLSPASLDGAPTQWLATVSLPSDRNQEATRLRLQAAIARNFPEVTTIDVARQVGLAQSLFARMSLAIAALSVVAVVAGLAVLLGICAASAHERRQDAALLRLCGATNAVLRHTVIAEFGLIGALAACLGVGLSLMASWLVLTHAFELTLTVPWLQLILLTLVIIGLCVLTGLAATRRVRRHAPLAVLRESGT